MAVATGVSEEVVVLLTALLDKENRTVSLSIKHFGCLSRHSGVERLRERRVRGVAYSMTQQRQSYCVYVDQTKLWVGCLSVHSRFEKLLQELNPDARNM